MNLPNISQYAESVSNPFGLTSTLGEFEVERDIYGKTKIRAGNHAAVFKIVCNGEPKMLKCYIKPKTHTAAIYNYIDVVKDPLLSSAKLLPNELYVYDALGNGEFYDVVISQWLEGSSLENEIRIAVKEENKERLNQLSLAFNELALELLEREWAHGDLKPENIIVLECGKLALIDYDAMFIPSLAGEQTQEIGTPAFQHPRRDSAFFEKSIDDYSIAIISVSLGALAIEHTLYEKYNTTDNIIFHPHEIISNTSQAYDEVLKMFANKAKHSAYNLARHLKTLSPRIENIRELLLNCTRPFSPTPQGKLTLMEQNRLWGYKDEAENVVIAPMYDKATEFSEGLAIVSLNGTVQAIAPCGRVMINDPRITQMKPFACRLAAVKIGGLWGYVNCEGELVISPKYHRAKTMHNGLAAVQKVDSKKWGYVNCEGDMVIKPTYDHAMSFRNGVATVIVDEKTIQIDTKGNMTGR